MSWAPGICFIEDKTLSLHLTEVQVFQQAAEVWLILKSEYEV